MATMPPAALAPGRAAAATGPGATAAAAPEAVRRAAEEFEAVFLAQMLAGMFDGLGGGAGPGGGAFEGMLRDEYARLIARSGGIGLADDIRREMLKLQEVT